jgi:recombination protein RecA
MKSADVIKTIAERVIKNYGTGAAVVPDSEKCMQQLVGHVEQWIPTALPGLDAVLGREAAGVPCGRLVEIYGAEAHGKSSLSYYLLGQTLRAEGYAFLIDTEGTFDEKWGKAMGVSNERLVVFPLTKDSCVEGYFDLIEDVVSDVRKRDKRAPVVFVLDTLVCTPTAEQLRAKSYRDTRRLMGLSRAMSEHLPSLCNFLSRTRTTLVLVNQIRDNVGVMWGEKYTTPGGHAIKHLCSVRAAVKRVSKLDGGAIASEIVNIKNKVAPAFKSTRVIISARGIVALPAKSEKKTRASASDNGSEEKEKDVSENE